MRKQRAERLRFAVQSLPPETRRSMLAGIKENRIVTGANTDRRGGVCPMLAADRNAFEVTPIADIFATAWDRYTGTSFVNVTRRTASQRDLKVLQSMLETSLALDAGAHTDIAEEIPAPRPARLARPDVVETTRTLTVAAKLEVIRALEATGHAPPVASRLETAPAAATLDATPAPVSRRSLARFESRPAPAVHAIAGGRSGRAPATKTQSELDRERARAIIANQASTLRRRAWPRPGKAAPQVELARPAPAAVPMPAPAAPTRRPERDRLQELAARSGWAWLPAFSSYDDYERTLQDLGETQRGPGSDDGGNRRDDTKQRESSRA